MRTVAALYVDARGPYPELPGVECWDEKRDARLYDGPHPIVAHPPCGPWSSCRHLYIGAEHDAGIRAVNQLLKFGGVLEQPKSSRLFAECGLGVNATAEPLPFKREPARADSFAVLVDQSDWGHVARKPTYLYCVGIPYAIVKAGIDARPFPNAVPTHWCSGRRHNKRVTRNVPPGIKVCSKEQRNRTPPLFAEWLVSLARASMKGM